MVETNQPGRSQIVQLQNVGPIEADKIDLSKYIGKESVIVRYEERKGDHGYFVLLFSDIVDVLPNMKNPLAATKMLSLSTDKEGKIGWKPKSKTAQYLAKMGVGHYKELVGKKVLLIPQLKEGGKEYLSF